MPARSATGSCLDSSRSRNWCSGNDPRWCWIPSEERIKGEFAGVKRSFLPMHSVLRIDEVRKQGVSKITALEAGANVAQFPMSMYSTPPGEKK